MKSDIIKYCKSLGIQTSYSGKTRTLYLKQHLANLHLVGNVLLKFNSQTIKLSVNYINK